MAGRGGVLVESLETLVTVLYMSGTSQELVRTQELVRNYRTVALRVSHIDPWIHNYIQEQPPPEPLAVQYRTVL